MFRVITLRSLCLSNSMCVVYSRESVQERSPEILVSQQQYVVMKRRSQVTRRVSLAEGKGERNPVTAYHVEERNIQQSRMSLQHMDIPGPETAV
jgi:hypothetical protein